MGFNKVIQEKKRKQTSKIGAAIFYCVCALIVATLAPVAFSLGSLLVLPWIIFEVFPIIAMVVNIQSARELSNEIKELENKQIGSVAIEENKSIIEQQKEKEREKRHNALIETRRKWQNKLDEALDNLMEYPISYSDDAPPDNDISNLSEIKISYPRKNYTYYNFAEFITIKVDTTGISNNDRICRVTALKFSNFKPIERFYVVVNPYQNISEEATRIHSITNEMVKNAPQFKSIIESLDNFIGSYNLVGHNIMFHLRHLFIEGYDFTNTKRKYYDTYCMAQKKIPKYDKYHPNRNFYVYDHTLGSISDCYDIILEKTRGSISECMVIGLVFERMIIEEYGIEPLEDDLQAKYRNMKIHEIVDGKYDFLG